ncbi:MAG: NifU family protein [Rhodospirillales bacterium]|nr:NifU family protein [Rhodospirillales bacterium]
MFIQTEATPNPATMKFIPGVKVLTSGTADFREGDDTERSPLAQRLFQIDGVVGVFLAGDFISVTKIESQDWHALKPPVFGILMEHFSAGRPVLLSDAVAEPQPWEEDSEVVAQIKDLLETRVRPAVAQDGGDIVFHGFDRGIVYLQMQGACAGCPSSTATLKMGIENMLKHYIPEVVEVRPTL